VRAAILYRDPLGYGHLTVGALPLPLRPLFYAGQLGHPRRLLLLALPGLPLLLELCHELFVGHREHTLLFSDVLGSLLVRSLRLEGPLLLGAEARHLPGRLLYLLLRDLGHGLLVLGRTPLYDDVDSLLNGLLHLLIMALLALWADSLLSDHSPLLPGLLEVDRLSALTPYLSACGLEALLLLLLGLLRLLAEDLLSYLPDYLVHFYLLITVSLRSSSLRPILPGTVCCDRPRRAVARSPT
jgi:hypothetical protein